MLLEALTARRRRFFEAAIALLSEFLEPPIRVGGYFIETPNLLFEASAARRRRFFEAAIALRCRFIKSAPVIGHYLFEALIHPCGIFD